MNGREDRNHYCPDSEIPEAGGTHGATPLHANLQWHPARACPSGTRCLVNCLTSCSPGHGDRKSVEGSQLLRPVSKSPSSKRRGKVPEPGASAVTTKPKFSLTGTPSSTVVSREPGCRLMKRLSVWAGGPGLSTPEGHRGGKGLPITVV